MNRITLESRVNVSALRDVENFIESAQHLKALQVQLIQRRCRRSRLELSLEQQIDTFSKHCAALAKGNPRLAELWTVTQAELRALVVSMTAAAEPLEGGRAVSGGYAPGTHAEPTNAKSGG